MKKNPYPGMNPYLEKYWGDVHQSLITYARDALQGQLPADLKARMQERVVLDAPDPNAPGYYPDVHIFERPARPGGTGGGLATLEPAEPLTVTLECSPIREGYIEVIDVKSGRIVVTTIEVLSPSNKRPGENQNQFVEKQDELRAAGVNTVEIDLLRYGQRVLAVRPDRLPEKYQATYHACVWRKARPKVAELYLAPLQRRLPVIPIPLRPTDRDVHLDLQALVDQSYLNGAYDDIDYRAEPEPALTGDDAAWHAAWTREQGLRP